MRDRGITCDVHEWNGKRVQLIGPLDKAWAAVAESMLPA